MSKNNTNETTLFNLEDCQFSSKDLSAAKQYMRDISLYPLLSKAETADLFDRYHSGDASARETLITSNLRLVVSAVKPFLNKGLDFEDLVQEGNKGLMTAIDKYDATKKGTFTTYAYTWIRQAMGKGTQNLGRAIRIPTHIQESAATMWEAKQNFEMEYGYAPNSCELSDYMDGKLSSDEIDDINDIYRRNNVDSLDREVYEDTSMYEVVASPDCYDDDDSDFQYRMSKDREIFMEAFQDLDKRSQFIIGSENGLDGFDQLSLDEIAEELGVGKERVRQLRKAAIKDLTNACNNGSEE